MRGLGGRVGSEVVEGLVPGGQHRPGVWVDESAGQLVPGREVVADVDHSPN